MGYYINPTTQTKEQFLKKFGDPIPESEVAEFNFETDYLPICLIDNVIFTAAGIAYDKRELEAFLNPDGRLRKWYLVSKENLKDYYP